MALCFILFFRVDAWESPGASGNFCLKVCSRIVQKVSQSLMPKLFKMRAKIKTEWSKINAICKAAQNLQVIRNEPGAQKTFFLMSALSFLGFSHVHPLRVVQFLETTSSSSLFHVPVRHLLSLLLFQVWKCLSSCSSCCLCCASVSLKSLQLFSY